MENPPTVNRIQGSFWKTVARWWKKRFQRKGKQSEYHIGQMQVRFVHGRFREILNLNDSLLRLFADIQDKISGRSAFCLSIMIDRIRRGLLDGFVLAKDLNQLTKGRYPELYDLLAKIESDLREMEQAPAAAPAGPLVVSIDRLLRSDTRLAGSKMASLGEIRSSGLAVPDGFVATTEAFREVMHCNNLEEAASELDAIYEARGYDALEQAAQRVLRRTIEGSLPPGLESALSQAYKQMACDTPVTLAARSSAVGEDSLLATHAGQYLTLLNVGPGELLDAYLRILASTFTPQAVIYRYQHGLTYHEAAMAVGFQRMLSPRLSGVMFTRDFQEPASNRMRLSVVRGVADDLVSGRINAREMVLDSEGAAGEAENLFQPGERNALTSAGRKLEKHFGLPQDIEWALDNHGGLFILQSRPMVFAERTTPDAAEIPDGEVLIGGGHIACPGEGYGVVVKVGPGRDLQEIPDGAILVMQQASPSYAYLFPRCGAVLSEAGSPSCHMAILCREAGVPALVGLKDVFNRLTEGQSVCVRAHAQEVYSAKPGRKPMRIQLPARLAECPAVTKLKHIGFWITPLNFTDPTSVDFRADRCQTLHDLVRFVHEKLYAAMFGFGEKAAKSAARSWRLQVTLPMTVLVTDLGGGLAKEPSESETLTRDDIASVPFQMFLGGLLDGRIDWTKPRAVSGSGFMSVIGESLIGSPAEAQDLTQPSFAVLAHQFMSFSSRAGYHFSVIEAVCSSIENKNFIHYSFGGGGAGEERRARRAEFLWQVLSTLGFSVQVKGDLVTARFLKSSQQETGRLLKNLGLLTLCSRQLDMLMDTDASPRAYAAAFLEERFELF